MLWNAYYEYSKNKIQKLEGVLVEQIQTSSQAPSYASPKLRLTDLLTGVSCRATSVAKNW